MTVGGVDTYYDYDEKQWKLRRLGGGPLRSGPVCPGPRAPSGDERDAEATTRGVSSRARTSRRPAA
ncbi:hypothetical protein E1218_24600 [Kribbella turkmenica]|uniref:Uncharacterized protein n=1 Tax=Kribbella turkmenica TaxID=2530375 RepID=A0A4R4WRU3_9ACTN|nr:hypothetical protein E1218_24600 [Kribbella turkmenica]